MQCIGHRGARGHAPENTRASFRAAIELGAHAVELDVHEVDGRLVVIHDDSVDRTTNGSGPLRDFSLDALCALDAGDGQRIPTLDDVLECIDRRLAVNIEIKGAAIADRVVDAVGRWRRRGWPVHEFLVSSFDHDQLVQARVLDPDVLLGVLVDESVEQGMRVAQDINACALLPSRELVTPELIGHAHELGLRVLVFTVNDPDEIEKMGKMGVDGLITDYPDRVLARWPTVATAPGWLAL
ncbi:MAG: glycerophosphodiester phosphodiesterase family protein [Verrucomicrobia bacterium]|nr:glycerophosphodiester phosphodiesterase family protein [Verrucomicrobiota bacterium]MDA1088491.1 glycerophosphodiester phosphodiesterase family protein [Verrucomicrobiota bacterium]